LLARGTRNPTAARIVDESGTNDLIAAYGVGVVVSAQASPKITVAGQTKDGVRLFIGTPPNR
jgi:hypothetical protein